jgi:beta-lactamase class A
VQERPTIYESAARRRSRTRRALLVAVAVVVLLAGLAAAAAWTLRESSAGGVTGGVADVPSSSPATPSPSSTSPGARLARLPAVEIHRGEEATFGYRLVEGPSGSPVTLIITGAAGEQVKARRLAVAEAGRRVSTAVRIDLEPGRYTYALRLGDGAAAEEDVTGPASARLRVLAPLPPAFPGGKAVATAAEWIAGRDGDVAFAVVDSNGRDAGGHREHETFQLASLSKAILLAASLRDDPTPDAASEATLRKMITESDNGAAYTVFGRVGDKGMKAVARAAGMDDYEQGAGWLDTRASAADQARLFARFESLVPVQARALARDLLSGVTPMQRWGIPAAAGPEGWTTYFKGGWLGLDNKLMVQAARIEKGNKTWALAVMSDENPTRSYGWDTQKGVTALLLGQEPTPAYLAVVLE